MSTKENEHVGRKMTECLDRKMKSIKNGRGGKQEKRNERNVYEEKSHPIKENQNVDLKGRREGTEGHFPISLFKEAPRTLSD